MHLSEQFLELVVWEQRLYDALEEHVDEASVETAVLEHVKHSPRALTDCVASQEMTQLI